MEEAAEDSLGLRRRGSPASAPEEEGFVRWDPARGRAEASDDSPAPVGGGGQPPGRACAAPLNMLRWDFWPWGQRSPASSSDRKRSPGASSAKYLEKDKAEKRDSLDSEWQPLEQDEAGGRSSLKAGTAAGWAKLESELQVLRNSTHPLALEFLQALERPIQIVAQLLMENQRLQQKLQSFNLVARLSAENQQLRQELQELKSHQRIPRIAANQMLVPKNTAFPVQLWITGQTKGCEKQFMDDVTRLLAGQRISLQVEAYRENSEQFLVLFCPVASRVGSDINSALEGLSSLRKAVLVVCHYKPRDSIQSCISVRQEAHHPALVKAVHACYSLPDGFYHCQMNEEAVAAVAAAIASERAGD